MALFQPPSKVKEIDLSGIVEFLLSCGDLKFLPGYLLDDIERRFYGRII